MYSFRIIPEKYRSVLIHDKKQFFVDFEYKKAHILLTINATCENFNSSEKKTAR